MEIPSFFVYSYVGVSILVFLHWAWLIQRPSHTRTPRSFPQAPTSQLKERELESQVSSMRSLINRVTVEVQKLDKVSGQAAETMSQARTEVAGTATHRDLKSLQDSLLRQLDHLVDYNQRLKIELSGSSESLVKQREQLERFKASSLTDGLTQAANRAHFDQRLAEAVANRQRGQEIFCLIMIDIDHFKKINDSGGHPLGDRVLANLAEKLRDALRTGDFLARYGGEEFAVIAPGATLAAARSIAESLRRVVEATVFTAAQSSERIPVTISLGVAEAAPEDTEAGLIARADAALYQAKNTGRNRYVAG